jgi:hypothetical protein
VVQRCSSFAKHRCSTSLLSSLRWRCHGRLV